MVLSFTEYFWGEKNNGFDVLYHNMKHGQLSSKEFAEFLKESCSVEESYAKALGRLAKYAGNCGAHGSFSPYWQVLKSLAEKLANLHSQLVHSWQDLMKDVHRYTDEQHKKHKQMKEKESGTLETVHSIQQTIGALHKAKETYHARCLEFERLRRENASPKDLEKAEAKYKKSNDEYRSLVDKYANVRNDFETKMLESCKRFQEVEENHLHQMRDFVETYTRAWETQHALMGHVHGEFKSQSENLTVHNLLETFIHTKKTGIEKPGPIQFEETDLSSLPPASTPTDGLEKEGTPTEKPKREELSQPSSPDSFTKNGGLQRSPATRASKWFLRKTKGDKKKDKKKKKKDKDKDGDDAKSQPQVDADGFSIRPDNPQNRDDTNSWYSSSDSDSDADERPKKIKVEIKPLNSPVDQPSGNVDQIKKSIEGLKISPSSSRRQTPVNDMKRSISVTDNMNSGKPSQDLLGLDFLGGSSSASTPTGGNYSFPPPDSTNTTPIIINNVADLLGNEASSSLSRQRSQTPTSIQRSQTPTLLKGPPPSRSSGRSKLQLQGPPRPGRTSPGLVQDRTESPASQTTFSTTSMPVGSSRGPSPLTLGMADTIPLAIAFSETANVYFKGKDEHSCMTKLTGDMLISFPAGIVKVLMDNPSPAMLSFRVQNSSRLEQILVNKQLVVQDQLQSTPDSLVYTFDMSTLSEHLRRQAEQNKSASHFNIDILKYQIKSHGGTASAPLQLQSTWKCSPSQTDFELRYKYNGSAIASPQPLTNVSVFVPVNGQVSNMQSTPDGVWNAENSRAIWKLGDISDMNESGGESTIQAKFDLNAGPSSPATIAVQFLCEGSTLSGIDFGLVGQGYRLSLVKKRFVSGKYICDATAEQGAV